MQKTNSISKNPAKSTFFRAVKAIFYLKRISLIQSLFLRVKIAKAKK